MSTSVKVFSPAKLNIFFAVTGKRNDGYHNVLSANFAINFGDEIIAEESDEIYDKVVSNINIFDEKNNTILSAIKLFRDTTGINKSFKVSVQKNIPTGAGFGGGSSNAVKVLQALNEMNGTKLSFDELCKIAEKIGADCPFFLRKNPCITKGIGEICCPADQELVSAIKSYNLTIFKPKFGVNTKAAYVSLRENFHHLYIAENLAQSKLDSLAEAVIAGEKFLPLYNTFSEMFFSEHKELLTLCNDLRTYGGNAMLTGSGSGFFCLSHKSCDVSLIEKIIKKFCGDDVFLVRTAAIV